MGSVAKIAAIAITLFSLQPADAAEECTTDACLQQMRKEVTALKAEVQRKAAPYLVKNSNARVWISYDALAYLLGRISGGAPQVATFESTEISGAFIGETWVCRQSGITTETKPPKSDENGWRLSPAGADSIQGSAQVDSVQPQWVENQGLAVRLAVRASVSSKLKLDVMPCNGSRFHWEDVISASSTATLDAQVLLNSDQAGQTSAAVTAISPSNVAVHWRLSRLPLQLQPSSVPIADLLSGLGSLKLSSSWRPTGTFTIPTPNGPALEKYSVSVESRGTTILGKGYATNFQLDVSYPN